MSLVWSEDLQQTTQTQFHWSYCVSMVFFLKAKIQLVLNKRWIKLNRNAPVLGTDIIFFNLNIVNAVLSTKLSEFDDL